MYPAFFICALYPRVTLGPPTLFLVPCGLLRPFKMTGYPRPARPIGVSVTESVIFFTENFS